MVVMVTSYDVDKTTSSFPIYRMGNPVPIKLSGKTYTTINIRGILNTYDEKQLQDLKYLYTDMTLEGLSVEETKLLLGEVLEVASLLNINSSVEHPAIPAEQTPMLTLLLGYLTDIKQCIKTE